MNHIALKDNFADLKSGTVLFLVALPLSLGVAMECNVPLFSGIIAGVVGGIVGAVISGSKYNVSGPAGGLIAVVISSIAQLGSFENFLAALVFAGIFQLILGFIKAGNIGSFIPSSVIKGMLFTVGILLIIKQAKFFFGYETMHTEGDSWIETGRNIIGSITPGVLIISVVCLLILFLSDRPAYKNNRFFSAVPATFLAVFTGALLNVLFSNIPFLYIGPQHLINVSSISPVSNFGSNFIFPSFEFINNSTFWISVFTIGIIASLETVLRVEAIDKLAPDKTKSNTNKELLAQGIANVFCGFIGGLPVTSVVARSSVNINSGAKTKLSIIFHAVLLGISVLLFPKTISLIPNACLGAVLIHTGYKLSRPSIFKEQLFSGMEEFVPFFITLVFMLFTNLLVGVCAGFIIALITIIIRKDSLEYSFETSTYVENGKTYKAIKLPQYVTFFNKKSLINFFDSVTSGTKVIIDGSKNKRVNQDIKEVISEFIASCKQKSIEVELIKFYA